MSANQAHDPEVLKHIMENNCQLPTGTNPLEFCLGLLDNFGSTDANLRDRLSYSLLARLLTEHNVLSVQDLQTILKLVLDDRHLFYRIGECGTDAVLKRAFSVLVVPLILDSDMQHPQIDADLVHETIHSVLSYARQEQDRRGYINGKGWAQSTGTVLKDNGKANILKETADEWI